jgi:hypothetical protein
MNVLFVFSTQRGILLGACGGVIYAAGKNINISIKSLTVVSIVCIMH